MSRAGDMLSEAGVRCERRGRVAVVTLNRPQAMNALRSAEQIALADIFDRFESDPDQWVAVLTGAGDRAFCAGHDLKQEAERDGGEGERLINATGFGGLTRRFARTKPVIAAVNGVAMGGGFEMALACDLIVASSTARFALPEPRVGLAALAGGIQRLIRAIGDKRAMAMLLTGDAVSAADGLALGFVNSVVDPDRLMEEALILADRIIACSPMSVRATIAVARHDPDAVLAAAMQQAWELPSVAALVASDDFREGPRAFAEKRPPRWTAQ